MNWQYDDGGRSEAGYKGEAGDCACRAIAIAAQVPYAEAYELVNRFGAMERRAKKRKSSARTGVYQPTMRKIMETLGFEWVATMGIGTGCTTHLAHDELPAGRIVCNVSKHYTAVIDGVIHDTHDPSRDGTRCVYGFWVAPGHRAKGQADERLARNRRELHQLRKATSGAVESQPRPIVRHDRRISSRSFSR